MCVEEGIVKLIFLRWKDVLYISGKLEGWYSWSRE